MAFGRACKAGPVGAAGTMTNRKFGKRGLGEGIGMIPVLGSFAMAIGYTVVMGWIVKYMIGTFTGSTTRPDSVEEYAGNFGTIATTFGNNGWQIIALVLGIGILVFGVAGGIEKANKVMMPIFFALFIGLGIYIFFQNGASDGYKYIFTIDVKGIRDPLVWVYGLGQAFFSQSIAGNGTLIYGSYLSSKAFSFYARWKSGINSVLCGSFFCRLKLTYNLYEAPIATVQEKLKFSRVGACVVTGGTGLLISLFIQGIVSDWMDVVSIYGCPLGAGLMGIMFFWIGDREFVESEVNKGAQKTVARWFYPLCKYVFCPICFIVLIAGAISGGIG